ncbi:hypothetical protein [Streptomyces sp. NPDC055749]
MTSGTTGSDRATRLRLLAAAIDGEVEAEFCDSARKWTFVWTDGPTAEAVRRAALEAEPEAAEGVRYVRRFSEDAVALGAIRLAVATSPDDARSRPAITPRAVEEFWRDVPFPSPRTERERVLIYAVIYQVRDGHHRNRADPEDICDLIGHAGLAPLLRRAGGELTPVEVLTAHYASTHAHPAWRYRLAPMAATTVFQAVVGDPKATKELLAAALTLLPGLPDTFGSAAAGLRARLHRLEGTS